MTWSSSPAATPLASQGAAFLKNLCPVDVNVGGNNTAPLDATTTVFDTVYHQELMQQKGLLHSNQELVNGGNSESADLVRYYSGNSTAFRDDFSASMIKMGNLKPLTGSNGDLLCNYIFFVLTVFFFCKGDLLCHDDEQYKPLMICENDRKHFVSVCEHLRDRVAFDFSLS
ncbi:peroxidase [Sarracenia purpurea var. burkii]